MADAYTAWVRGLPAAPVSYTKKEGRQGSVWVGRCFANSRQEGKKIRTLLTLCLGRFPRCPPRFHADEPVLPNSWDLLSGGMALFMIVFCHSAQLMLRKGAIPGGLTWCFLERPGSSWVFGFKACEAFSVRSLLTADFRAGGAMRLDKWWLLEAENSSQLAKGTEAGHQSYHHPEMSWSQA